jgi:hypothetical protein
MLKSRGEIAFFSNVVLLMAPPCACVYIHRQPPDWTGYD